MYRKKITLIVVLMLIIQFIQPEYNKSKQTPSTDFATIYSVPDRVQIILHNACYDCHSNTTRYPWYSYIQPLGWVLTNHINYGKEELNFSEFGQYSTRKQINKFKGIANQVKDDRMPIYSYRLLHRSANLTNEDKLLIQNWMNKMADTPLFNN